MRGGGRKHATLNHGYINVLKPVFPQSCMATQLELEPHLGALELSYNNDVITECSRAALCSFFKGSMWSI